MGINKVILVGNVGKDPSVQYIKEDIPVARFTLATSETYRNKNGEKVTNTEWHNLVAWRRWAKVVEQYIKKGTQLYIEGKLTTRSYEKDGATKYFTEIVVNQLQMLGKAQDSSSTSKESTPQQEQVNDINQNEENLYAGEYQETDDLPF
jgi:single-strand DNA-binding protein